MCIVVRSMKLSEDLEKKLKAKFEASSTVTMRYRNNDMVIRTDKEGNAIQVFIGKANEDGLIKGDRYSRSIIRDREGKVIKDFWERKGKAS